MAHYIMYVIAIFYISKSSVILKYVLIQNEQCIPNRYRYLKFKFQGFNQFRNYTVYTFGIILDNLYYI